MPRTTTGKTISLAPTVKQKGVRLAKRRGFANSFSAYVGFLIQRDDELVRREEATTLANGKEVAS